MTIFGEIAEVDANLSPLREGWMQAPKERKRKWVNAINGILDQRLKLMAICDGKAEPK